MKARVRTIGRGQRGRVHRAGEAEEGEQLAARLCRAVDEVLDPQDEQPCAAQRRVPLAQEGLVPEMRRQHDER